jgi:hypothetical protein
MWFDSNSDRVQHGGTSASGKYRFYGSIASDNGTTFQCRCETADGKTGRLEINDQKFELSAGGLFLVSTKTGKAIITQIGAAISEIEDKDLKQIDAGLEKLATTQPELMRFVEGNKDKKKGSGEARMKKNDIAP